MNKIKCVIFDLDQTIWTGILSEEEVTLKEDIIRIITELDEKGILMSIASKNSMETAMTKLKELKIDRYFIFPQINFKQKYQNVLQISECTGISTEQMGFVDDDIYELEEIQYYLPDVMIIHSDELIDAINSDAFQVENITQETKNRRLYFMSEMKRMKDQEKYEIAEKNEEFDSQLNMTFCYRDCEKCDLERVNELVNRTHKLNNCVNLNNEMNTAVFEYSDSYFDHGIVGVFGYRIVEDILRIETVCISCRLFARGIVDFVLLGFIQVFTNEYNLERVQVDLKLNKENSYFLLLLKKIGFFKIEENRYEQFIKDIKVPKYIKIKNEVREND